MTRIGLLLGLVMLLTACFGSSTTPTVNALCDGLRTPLVNHVGEIIEHTPHPDVRVSGAKVVAVYNAGCPNG
jgi:hypothetical protein